MNKIKTIGSSYKTSTTIILEGKMVSKDGSVIGAAFCLKEGVCEPTYKDQIVGLIAGDVPICRFASTVLNLNPNTKYSFRAVSADLSKPSYFMNPFFSGVSIVSDDRGLVDGDTTVFCSYNATTKHCIITNEFGSGEVDFSPGGDIIFTIPVEMGGGDGQSITFNVDLSLLPTEDISGDMTITKFPFTFFYGKTLSFKTSK